MAARRGLAGAAAVSELLTGRPAIDKPDYVTYDAFAEYLEEIEGGGAVAGAPTSAGAAVAAAAGDAPALIHSTSSRVRFEDSAAAPPPVTPAPQQRVPHEPHEAQEPFLTTLATPAPRRPGSPHARPSASASAAALHGAAAAAAAQLSHSFASKQRLATPFLSSNPLERRLRRMRDFGEPGEAELQVMASEGPPEGLPMAAM